MVYVPGMAVVHGDFNVFALPFKRLRAPFLGLPTYGDADKTRVIWREDGNWYMGDRQHTVTHVVQDGSISLTPAIISAFCAQSVQDCMNGFTAPLEDAHDKRVEFFRSRGMRGFPVHFRRSA